ncbi:16S rRNA (guanine(527)-N(7))-methyltransferase RsmG [Chloroflexi bacterium TSY]|nr:16S rRNA (guanine(527)-N(7))-methyltransferase RsmG [Chloroflexi bacterium TSY]
MKLLIQGCQALGINITQQQIQQFELYYEKLVEWNQKFNLTAITDYDEIQTKHFLDSIASLPILAQQVKDSAPIRHPYKLIDVGTGAGFPGVPLKITNPTMDLTLMDGTGKKIQFLNHLVVQLTLDSTTIIQGRAEELGQQPGYREKYDLVTARAVAPLKTLIEYLLPLACLDGLVIVYKGGNAAQEFAEAQRGIEILGGKIERFSPVEVPYLDQERYILLIRKCRNTPKRYPRGQGLARKQPLT